MRVCAVCSGAMLLISTDRRNGTKYRSYRCKTCTGTLRTVEVPLNDAPQQYRPLGRRVYSDADIADMRALHKRGADVFAIVDLYGISEEYCRKILSGKRR